MSIDRLSPTSALIAALRTELARKNGRTTSTTQSARPAAPASTRDAQSLRRELAVLVREVDVDDEEAMKSARRRIVRAVLQREFGSELREYSEWQPMVETLVSALEANDVHRTEFRRLVQSLKS